MRFRTLSAGMLRHLSANATDLTTMKPLLSYITAGLAVFAVSSPVLLAQTKTWKGQDGNFLDAANWDSGVPGAADTAKIANGGKATIPADAGNRALSSVQLGPTEGSTESGHIIMNGGVWKIGGTEGDSKALIGLSKTLSTFVMNGGTILFDGPDLFPGESKPGVNELDWEVGEKGLGRFEMHGNSIFRAGDDLKIAENAAGNGSCLIDGNALITLGSGLSISGGDNANQEQSMVIAGNARVDSGNSMGAGSELGTSEEGYLTMATGGSKSRLTIQENGVLNIRRLTARAGTSFMTVKDNGQFHIFDVSKGKGFINANTKPDRPMEDKSNSTYASLTPSDATLILQDNAQMTVNSAQGLGISAPRDASDAGGTARLIVRDKASLTVEQYLALGTGTDATTSNGTLEVIGGGAKVDIKGDLNMAVDPEGNIAASDAEGNPAAGKASLIVTLNSASASTINVGGTARIAQGRLVVKLDGYAPKGGESLPILKAAKVDGKFKEVDISGATLAAGLKWETEYAATGVQLKVSGQATGAGGDTAKFTPTTPTFYINTPDTLNNGKTESIGVSIASNGNVIIGWEDDGDGLSDQEAVWTLFDPSGKQINPELTFTTTQGAETLKSKFLAYFRADKSPVSGATAWGPKIKANLFGDGIGMGATAFSLGLEIAELKEINLDASEGGDFPAVQLLNNDGTPISVVSGVADADAQPQGNIRIGDWDYLADGNVVIVGESRQDDVLVSKFGGDAPGKHAIYRIVDRTGKEVKAVALVSETKDPNEIWHGVGSTKSGFAVRFAKGGRATVRIFDNAGKALTGDLDLATVAGNEAAAGGGRGDGAGFHGNGNDAYAVVSGANDIDGNGAGVWLTVLNADGKLRFARNATEGSTFAKVDRNDVAIDATGRTLVTLSGTLDGTDVPLIYARAFDATGKPLGALFPVSEKETAALAQGNAIDPRAAWRGDNIAVVWESANHNAEKGVVAARFFKVESGGGTTTTEPIGITSLGISGGNLSLNWKGGVGPFTVQSSPDLKAWTDLAKPSERSLSTPATGPAKFFRVRGN